MKNSKFKNLFSKETITAIKASNTEKDIKENMSKSVKELVDTLSSYSKKAKKIGTLNA